MITGDVNVQRSVSGAVQLPKASAACGLTEEVKQALLTIAQKVAYIDEHGQDYYDTLYAALYPPAALVSISAAFTQGNNIVYDTDSLDSLKQYLTVTALYDDETTAVVTGYTLSGTLTEGTSTVTASYNGKTATFTVTVTHYEAAVTGITAVFTQGDATIYETDSLNDLKQYLVVTVTYEGGATATVSDYSLSGALTEGTSTITVTYSGFTDTFSVTVTAAPAVQITMVENRSRGTTVMYSDGGETQLTSQADVLRYLSDVSFDSDTDVMVSHSHMAGLTGREVWVSTSFDNGATGQHAELVGTVAETESGVPYTVKTGGKLFVMVRIPVSTQYTLDVYAQEA